MDDALIFRRIIRGVLKHPGRRDATWKLETQWSKELSAGAVEHGLAVRPEFRALTTRAIVVAEDGEAIAPILKNTIRMPPVSAYRRKHDENPEMVWHHTLAHEVIHSRQLTMGFGLYLPLALPSIVALAILLTVFGPIDKQIVFICAAAAVALDIAFESAILYSVEDMAAEMGAVLLANRLGLIDGVRQHSIDYVYNYLRKLPPRLHRRAVRIAWSEAKRRAGASLPPRATACTIPVPQPAAT